MTQGNLSLTSSTAFTALPCLASCRRWQGWLPPPSRKRPPWQSRAVKACRFSQGPSLCLQVRYSLGACRGARQHLQEGGNRHLRMDIPPVRSPP
ncbi:hypothetical protein E2C01_039484 [Portunus trituberculatus]|uniref:Uncharacterized protein n=1 Tax=Portunus trituberculatus TaxID=210409 RepID=A0A5B7FKW2_PORTR|nr:hypothetical protein [Portunus trituberculatus]